MRLRGQNNPASWQEAELCKLLSSRGQSDPAKEGKTGTLRMMRQVGRVSTPDTRDSN